MTSEDGQTLYALIIECDEDQHKGYSCENKRIMELFEDCGRVPIVLVRFNPHAYTDHAGVRQKSCFKHHKNGMPRVERPKVWKQRLNTLLELARACKQEHRARQGGDNPPHVLRWLQAGVVLYVGARVCHTRLYHVVHTDMGSVVHSRCAVVPHHPQVFYHIRKPNLPASCMDHSWV